jgi:hypothetical protein
VPAAARRRRRPRPWRGGVGLGFGEEAGGGEFGLGSFVCGCG